MIDMINLEMKFLWVYAFSSCFDCIAFKLNWFLENKCQKEVLMNLFETAKLVCCSIHLVYSFDWLVFVFCVTLWTFKCHPTSIIEFHQIYRQRFSSIWLLQVLRLLVQFIIPLWLLRIIWIIIILKLLINFKW